jgi:hypothetical protein
LLLLALAAAVACSDSELGDAATANVVDTVTLGAINGAALTTPAAYSITVGSPIRTDESSAFDFAYDIIPGKGAVLLPLAALGLGTGGSSNPGLQKVTTAFDDLKSGPTSGWLQTDTIPIAVGNVIAGRSRIVCYLGVPQYAKFQILAFNDVLKTVDLKVLANVNCGYRNLEPGTSRN